MGADGSSHVGSASSTRSSGPPASAVQELRTVQTEVLDIGYEESGNSAGFPVILLHGFPYDVRSFDGAVAPLAEAGHRVLVPYLRGYGPTRFRDPDAPRQVLTRALPASLRR